MSLRERRRRGITEATLEEILQPHRLDKLYQGLESMRRLMKKGESDLVDDVITHLRAVYRDSTKEEQEILRNKIYEATSYIPNYSRFLTRSMYWLIKKIGQESVFDKIHITGYTDDVLERARQGRLIILPTHNDMFDTILVAYLFLEHGLKLPVFQMGDNLKKGVNSFILQRFNAMFIRRKDVTSLDNLLYAKHTEQLLKDGENFIIYPEGTRSRDGKIKKPKDIKRGFVAVLLRANNSIQEDMYSTTATVSSPIFYDIFKDYLSEQDTGKKTKINTFARLLNMEIFNNVSAESGIWVNFTRPVKIHKGPSSYNIKLNRDRYTRIIRNQLKNNITVLGEYLMAYTLRYIQMAEPDYYKLDPKQRLSMIWDLYECHAEHILSKEKINHADNLDRDLPRSFEVALEFYKNISKFHPDLEIINKDHLIKEHLLLRYNSNKIQHFLKDKFPLVAEERLGFFDRFKY